MNTRLRSKNGYSDVIWTDTAGARITNLLLTEGDKLQIIYSIIIINKYIYIYIHRIFRSTMRALSIQKRCKIVKNEHARYTLERFPTDNTRVICTKKGIGKYGIMY
jgi:hypothetical protein